MSGITEIATAFPGNTGQVPARVAPLAEMLRLNGYSTAQFGKNHETAAWEVSVSGPTNGAILAQGGRFGGWSFYVQNGKPVYTYNWLGLKQYTIAGKEPLAPGKAPLCFELTCDGGSAGKGGAARILVNGREVANGRIEQTQCCMFPLDEAANVGRNDGTPVSESYRSPFAFDGKIEKVTITVGETSDADRSASESVRRESRAKRALAV